MASERWVRDKTEQAFGFVEDLLYVLVALALSLAGLLLFGYAIYEFASKVQSEPLSAVILALLDTLLLVFIITEIIHTIRVVIDEKILVSPS
jgi:hypothetical protein